MSHAPQFQDILPAPPISLVISSIRSIGNGDEVSGFIAMDISFMGLSSAAMRLELICPHWRHRCMIAHSPFFLTQTATGSIFALSFNYNNYLTFIGK